MDSSIIKRVIQRSSEDPSTLPSLYSQSDTAPHLVYQWFHQLRTRVASIRDETFIRQTFFFQWCLQEQTNSIFTDYVTSIVSAQPNIAKLAFQRVLQDFKSVTVTQQAIDLSFSLIMDLLRIAPTTQDMLVPAIAAAAPAPDAHPRSHIRWAEALLRLIAHPQCIGSKQLLTHALLYWMVQLDTALPQDLEEELEKPTLGEGDVSMSLPMSLPFKHSPAGEETEEADTPKPGSTVATALDEVMLRVFRFLEDMSDADLESFCRDALIPAFTEQVMPAAYACQAVQFVMFVAAQRNGATCDAFMGRLFGLGFAKQHHHLTVALAAAGYLASFGARAKALPLPQLKGLVSLLGQLTHAVGKQSGGKLYTGRAVSSLGLRSLRALLYLLCFRWEPLLDTMASLDLPTLMCLSTPLPHIPAVSEQFLQMAYEGDWLITEDIERAWNQLSQISPDVLPPFYPFDPYILPKSRMYVAPLYLEWAPMEEEEDGAGMGVPGLDDME
eukprot:gnl/Dysnectes_brevis/3376_a4247_694.p1 GENE.gnl/Dysnectes_brevis/3376_a4247_694~~gnl/Dysnectes_brevis/3376_a4247_694.p1  ORF type:complete len:498 (+),score=114.05 gnl/Dysnectes_brevis/3376_a4247_694:49-1542(+)